MIREDDLRALPHPAAPPELAATVMARIARIEDAHPHDVQPSREVRTGWSEWLAYGGLAAGLVILVAAYTNAAGSLVRLSTAPSVLSALPTTALGAVAFVAGVACYVGGLFLPLRTDGASQAPRAARQR